MPRSSGGAFPGPGTRAQGGCLLTYGGVDDTGGTSDKDSGMEAHISLMGLLEGLHDPRRVQGKRHPLPALLALAVVAQRAGMTSSEAIVHYGKERGWGSLPLLGFTTRWGLGEATSSRV